MSKKILAVAVHPDDETLGCGGALLKHAAAGDELYWVIVTAMKGPAYSAARQKRRAGTIRRVAAAYGFRKVFALGIPAAGVDRCPRQTLTRKFEAVFGDVRPDTVYVPFRYDVHSDHRAVFESVLACSKSFRAPWVKSLLMMETVSETEFAPAHKGFAFVPNYFVDISRFLKEKLRIAALYREELGRHPFPRSIAHLKALACHRGAVAGCAAAEGFMLLKHVC